MQDFNCGRVKRRLEALRRKYEELHEHAQEDRFAQMQAEEKEYNKMLRELETAVLGSGGLNDTRLEQEPDFERDILTSRGGSCKNGSEMKQIKNPLNEDLQVQQLK